MKNIKYITLIALAIGFTSCNDESDFEDQLDMPPQDAVVLPSLTAGSADFSKYVAIGASFTAGFTDGGLFMAGQEDSFPNTLAKQFANAGGGTFTQPLTADNFGGLAVGGTRIQDPRLVFGGAGPVPLEAVIGPVTVGTDLLAPPTGPFNNLGVPGAKSFHMIAPGYGNLANLSAGLANPYATRLTGATPNASIVQLAVAQNASFFTLSEVGGNDVLGYALSGAESNTTSTGFNPITPTATFDFALNTMVTALTANGAKGAIGNVPDITSLSHFTTVPFDALDPSNPALAPQIPVLNAQLYGPLNQIFTAFGEPDRINILSTTEANPILINDEDAADRSAAITGALTPVLGAPTATLFGQLFGKARQATAADLFVLPASAVIATPVAGVPAPVNVNGVSFPMQDKWVLTPNEQAEIATATAAYNSTISSITSSNPDLALVDLNNILSQATSAGVQFDDYNLNTSLVFGGLISLDGIHLTARGYALMANAFLDAIDTEFGSNFRASGNVAKADDFGVNYSPLLP